MKYSLILLLIATLGWTQTTTTGKAETSGRCSPAVTGNNNQFRINCTGMDKEQGRKMLALMNNILAKQLDPAAVMAKLDEIEKGVQGLASRVPKPRVISPAQRDEMSKVLLATPERHKPLLLINGGEETQAFALQLASIFLASNWPLFGGGAMSSNFVPTGREVKLLVYPGNTSAIEDAKVVREAFRQAGIDAPIEEDPTMKAQPDNVHILIFPIIH